MILEEIELRWSPLNRIRCTIRYSDVEMITTPKVKIIIQFGKQGPALYICLY